MQVNIQIVPGKLPDGTGAVCLAVEVAGVSFNWVVPCAHVEKLISDLRQAKQEAEGSIVLATASLPRGDLS